MQEQHHPEEQNLQQRPGGASKLEEDVRFMAQKISDFRNTFPDQLKHTLASIFSAQRPANLTRLDEDSDPGPSDASTPLDSEGAVKKLAEKDQKHTENVEMIKQKIFENDSAMPLLVKRMKVCVSRINNLDSFKQDMIHPAFTKKW